MKATLDALLVLQGVAWRDLRRRPASAIAATLAIAVGVGVFVGVHLAGVAARGAFSSTVTALSGTTTHEVVRPGGVDPRRLSAWMQHADVTAAQPVLEGALRVLSVGDAPEPTLGAPPPLRVLGLAPLLASPFSSSNARSSLVGTEHFAEFLTTPGAAVVSRTWADSASATVGDVLGVAVGGRRQELRVLALFEVDAFGDAVDNLAVVDIATAQEIFGRLDSVDRIELILRSSNARSEARVRASLAPGERLQRPIERGERVARMVDAFRLNLTALAALALLVGGVLVFNATQFRVVRRLDLFGQLRCLGVLRHQLGALVLVEAALLGAVGGLLGIGLGVFLARALAGPVTRTIRDLYSFVEADVGELSLPLAFLVVLGASGVALVAATFPALDAARTAPRFVADRSPRERRFRARAPRLLLFAGGAVLVAAAAAGLPSRHWWLGLVAAVFLLLAGACLLPVFMLWTLPLLQRVSDSLGMQALSHAGGTLLRTLSRSGAAAAALSVALSMTVGVILMVAAFEAEVRRWIDQSLPAHVYVADATEKLHRSEARIATEVVDAIRDRRDVRGVDTLRGLELPYRDRSLFFCGMELTQPESWARLALVEGALEDVRRDLTSGACLISEPLSNRYGLHAGDSLRLPTPRGIHDFAVAGVFRDFSYDRGYAFLLSDHFAQRFGERPIRNAAVFLHDPLRSASVAEELRSQFAADHFLLIRSNATLRRQVLDVFGRTFRVTYLLQVISSTMALAGVAVTLCSIFLERLKELATLRALGAGARQLARFFVAESLLLGAYPVLVSIPLGGCIAWVLVAVVNLRAFGWTISLEWSWPPVLFTGAMALVSALAAASVPYILTRRQSIAEGLHEE